MWKNCWELPVEQIRKDICVLGKLNPGDSEDPEKNYLEEIRVDEQKEWDFEYVHQKTGEQRWFHNIAMGSEVNGKKKYILVMSDRTSDKKMNQALSEAVRAAETCKPGKEYLPFQHVSRYPDTNECDYRFYDTGCKQY